MSQPAPNRGDSHGVFIVECDTLPSGFFGFDCSTDFGFIPDGSAWVGLANPSLLFPGIEFTFPGDVSRASLFLAGENLSVTAFDASGTQVDFAIVPGAPFTQWSTNLVEVSSAGGIRTIWIEGDGSGILRLDALSFATIP